MPASKSRQIANSHRLSKVVSGLEPVYNYDAKEIIAQVKASGLVDDVARKKVTQLITDKIQLKGLDKVPDSVLNCTIELCYQIYVWKAAKK